MNSQINQLNAKQNFTTENVQIETDLKLEKLKNCQLQSEIQNNHAELLRKTTQINILEQLKVRKIIYFENI